MKFNDDGTAALEGSSEELPPHGYSMSLAADGGWMLAQRAPEEIGDAEAELLDRVWYYRMSCMTAKHPRGSGGRRFQPRADASADACD